MTGSRRRRRRWTGSRRRRRGWSGTTTSKRSPSGSSRGEGRNPASRSPGSVLRRAGSFGEGRGRRRNRRVLLLFIIKVSSLLYVCLPSDASYTIRCGLDGASRASRLFPRERSLSSAARRRRGVQKSPPGESSSRSEIIPRCMKSSSTPTPGDAFMWDWCQPGGAPIFAFGGVCIPGGGGPAGTGGGMPGGGGGARLPTGGAPGGGGGGI